MTRQSADSQRRSTLSPAKRALLERRLRGQTGQTVSVDPIPPRAETGPARLSFAQERMWFICQLNPQSPAYNMVEAVRLEGKLDKGALSHSFRALIERHDVLRTRFEAHDGRPVQVIDPDVAFSLKEITSDSPSPDGEPAIQDLIVEEARRPFDLTTGPLLRATLVEQGAQDHTLILVVHHIIYDEWSNEIFWRELSAFYRAFVADETPSLADLPASYADFAAWQRAQVARRGADQLAYWQRQLDGDLPRLSLTADRPRPAQQSFCGALQWTTLPDDLYARIKQLNQAHGATTFMTMLAAFQLLLSRYALQHDILVGAPMANRSHPHTKGMIGLFLNTLVLRAAVRPDLSFTEFAQAVRQTALDAYANQDLPFEQLVDALQPQRNASHNPLFQVMFVHQNAAVDAIDLPGLTATPLPVDMDVAKFDLTLFVQESKAGLSAGIEYNTDLFDRTTAQRILAHYRTLLTAIVADPQRPVGDLELMSPTERDLILHHWNHPIAEPRPDRCIHHLIEEQAAANLQALAVADEVGELTYGELDAQANQLARYLQARGVGPDVVVGLALPRNREMIVAILAVHKAGGAYLPLDPAAPPARTAFMLADAQASLLLTHTRLALDPAAEQVETIRLDAVRDEIAAQSDAPVKSAVDADHLAYVIFTSGSTGQPKGVGVTHGNLVHSTTARFDAYDRPVSRFLLLSAFTFDSSIVGIFWTLCQGGGLIVPPQRIEQDMARLATIIAERQATHLLCLPSLHRLILDLTDTDRLQSLQTVIVAGEACPPELVAQHYARLPDTDLYNEYGPTEGTVWSTAYKIPADFDRARVPIGRSIPNMQNYVLDEAGRLAPIGVPGELCIAGAGLTDGYLNRPELTAQKFVERRLDGATPLRLYRTGDLARYLPDGNLEFLGRMDHQVKIRGFRVEIGEIEAALSQHPTVRQAAVAAHAPDGGASLRLAAYVEAADGQVVAPDVLRRFLSDRLPDYMVPATISLLPALPLTATGKVDRRRLPAPEADPPAADTASIAPRSPLEAQLAAVWTEVLGVEQVGVHDNFFELGGDSILSIQIVAKAARHGIRLKPTAIFQHPTVAALAATAATDESGAAAPQNAVTGPVLLTPIQQWLLEQNLSEPHHWNQAYLLAWPPEADPDLIEAGLAQLALHHDALRLRVRRSADGWVQESGGPDVGLRLLRRNLSDLPEAERQAALAEAVEQAQASLQLDGAMAQAVWFEMGAGRPPRLLLVIHHLSVDGVSWQILLEDLETAYDQLRAGEAIRLPPKTTSFQQAAARLTELAQSSELQADLAFWLQEGSAEAAEPRPDFPDGIQRNTVGSGAAVTTTFSAEETETLLRDVPAAYQTQINDALLTALLLAIEETTGARSLHFDLEGHGREIPDLDLSRTVGWFTTVFPVTLRVPSDASVKAALIDVKETLRQIPRKGLSYGLLRYLHEDADVRRRLAEQPQPIVTFNYLGRFDQDLAGFSLFRAAPETPGPERSPHDRSRYLLEINSMIEAGRLIVRWGYSEHVFREATVAALADAYQRHLRALIDHCTTPGVGGYTPSDFPLVRLAQPQLDRIAEIVERRPEENAAAGRKKQIAAIHPLSPMQELMLVHELGPADSGMLLTQAVYTLHGPADGDALRTAWQHLVARHPALRTGFDWTHGDSPLQIVGRQAHADFDEVDLRPLPAGAADEAMADLLARDRARGFDLAHPPLMRMTLVRLTDETAKLVWSSHHLIIDRWCAGVLLQELFALYTEALGARPASLEPARSFGDYIAWLQRQDGAAAATFWRMRLAGMTRPTLLFGSLPAAPTNPRQTVRAALPGPQLAALQAMARRRQLTLNTLVQGAWALLLSRYCQADDVLFGATVAGRPADIVGVESIIGSFINNLPVRVRIDPTMTVAAWLQQIQAAQNDAQPYEYVAPASLQAWSDLPDAAPLFDTLLIYQSSLDLPALQGGGLRVMDVDGDLATIYPLALSIFEQAGALQLWGTFDAVQVSEAAVDQVLDEMARLLTALGVDADQTVAHLLASTAGDMRQVLQAPAASGTPVQDVIPARRPLVASRTETERRLTELWQEVLGVSPIGVQDDFFALGGASLQVLRLVMRIQDEFGRDLPLASFIQTATIEHITALLQTEEADEWSALVPIQPLGDRPAFFCVHGLTGDVLWFRELGQRMPAHQPFYGIQARGLDGVSAPFDQIEPMAAYYIEQMRTIQPAGPYYFGGASFGGTVALEMARQLLDRGEGVGLLVMFDHAPDAVDANFGGFRDKTVAGWRVAKNFPHWLGSFAQMGVGPMAARMRRKARLAVKQAGVNGSGESLDGSDVDASDLLDYGAELPAYRQRMIRAHHRAIQTYVLQPYPGRITLFQAQAQPLLATSDPSVAWRTHPIGALDYDIVPGSHEGMFHAPHVDSLARRLCVRLTLAQARDAAA